MRYLTAIFIVTLLVISSSAQREGDFTVQVASYNNATEADETATRLRSSGFDAQVVRAEIAGKGTWYRIQVGRFGSQMAADKYGARLQSEGTIQRYAVVRSQGAASSQGRSKATQRKQCITVNEIEPLLRDLKSLREPSMYILEDSTHYSDHHLSDVQRNYPIAYMFFQRGFLNMEDYGVHTFQHLTPKGRELMTAYPGGIPFSNQTLVSVDRVTCIGKTAQVQVTILIKPTQSAMNLLGTSVSQTAPFDKPQKKKVKLVYNNGKWQAEPNTWVEFLPFFM